MTPQETYSQNLNTIALTVNRRNRFQPEVYFDGTRIEFAIVDTATTDEFGDPVVVAEPSTLIEAIEGAYGFTLTPERLTNDWSGIR